MIIERQGVRALLLTGAREVLLLRIRLPKHDPFWIAPGGGLQPGESPERALRRELREELGLSAFAVGPLVWRRQHTFDWDGRRVCQREHYHVVDVDRFEPRMSDPVEAMTLDEFRWWSIAELEHATERLTPFALAKIVASYITFGAPARPPDWDVVVST